MKPDGIVKHHTRPVYTRSRTVAARLLQHRVQQRLALRQRSRASSHQHRTRHDTHTRAAS
jgi:hypothetical protein